IDIHGFDGLGLRIDGGCHGALARNGGHTGGESRAGRGSGVTWGVWTATGRSEGLDDGLFDSGSDLEVLELSLEVGLCRVRCGPNLIGTLADEGRVRGK